MKKTLHLTLGALALAQLAWAQNVGIGTASPNASAKLEIADANRGILFPRVSLSGTNDATTVTSPANWLIVFNTATVAGANAVTPGLYYWNGTVWVRLSTSNDAWQILGNAGTNPTNNFIGTTDAQSFVFRTSNTERMRIAAGGNVGIGTATPAAPLDVVGSAQTMLRLRATGATAGTGDPLIKFSGAYNSGDGLELWQQINGDFVLGFSSTARLLTGLAANGNIGIGINAPAEKLHVVGNIRTSSLSGVGTRLVSSDVNGTLTNFANGTNGQVLTMVAGVPTWSANPNWLLDGNVNGALRSIGTNDNFDLPFETNNLERMRITNGGNVGIGTTGPTARLEVAGNAVVGGSGIAGANSALTHISSGAIGNEAFTRLGYWNGTINTGIYDVGRKAGDVFTIRNVGSGTEDPTRSFYMLTGGNVGIGTASPLQKLHVAGDVQFQDHLYTPAINRMTPIVVRGTGYPAGTPRIVDVGSSAIAVSARGLSLIIVDKATHSIVSNTNYDTHGTPADADNLATALNNLNQNQIGILVSFDAWEMNVTTNLRNAFLRLGLNKAFSASNPSALLYRTPYAAIFEAATGAINTASAVEILQPGNITTGPHAELRAWIMEGGFVAGNQQPSALVTPQGSQAAWADANGNVTFSNMAGGGNRNVYVDNNGTLRATAGATAFVPQLFRYAVAGRTDFLDVNVGCDNVPEARFVILQVYHFNRGCGGCGSGGDHVTHIFGRSFPTFSTWNDNTPGTGTDYYNHNDPAVGDFAIVVCPGEADNHRPFYGKYDQIVVPLKSNKRIDIRLGDGYSGGTHYVKVRAMGYLP